jgi:hypothetical protein
VDVLVHTHGIKILLNTLKHDSLFIGDLQPQLDTELPVEFSGGDGGKANIIKFHLVGV